MKAEQHDDHWVIRGNDGIIWFRTCPCCDRPMTSEHAANAVIEELRKTMAEVDAKNG